jgi:hypothetical protein
VQQRLREVLDEFLHSAFELSNALRRSHRAITELSDSPARHHVLTAAVTRAFHRLQAAQRQVAWHAGKIRSRDNYVLDAALQSARGLVYRVRLARADIDARLEQEALTEAADQRRRKISSLSTRIDELRRDLFQSADQLFAAQQELKQGIDEVPEFLQATVAFRVAREKRDLMKAQLDRVGRLLAETSGTRPPPPVDPGAVRLLHRSVQRKPANFLEVMTLGLLGWCSTFLLILGGHRLARGS